MTTIQGYTKAGMDAILATLATSAALTSGLSGKADASTVSSLSTNVSNMGYIKDGQLTSNGAAIGSTETDSGLTTGSFSVISSRKYRVDVNALVLPSVANNIAACRLVSSAGPTLAQNAVYCPNTTYAMPCNMTYFFTASSTGSITIKLRLQLVVGSGTVQLSAGATYPNLILVTDIT